MNHFEGLEVVNAGGDNELCISKNARFRISKISISGNGNSVSIGECNHIEALNIALRGNNKRLTISDSSKYIRNLKIVSIRGDRQVIEIGSQFGCGGFEIQMNDGDEAIYIGDDCLFSWGIKARTSDGHSVVDLTTRRAINLPADIRIGSHVWVGEDARFLKGSSIGCNSVVASGSVLTKKLTTET